MYIIFTGGSKVDDITALPFAASMREGGSVTGTAGRPSTKGRGELSSVSGAVTLAPRDRTGPSTMS